MEDYVTIGFAMSVEDLPGNPFKIDTPFGQPDTIAKGNVFDERDQLQDRVDGLQSDLEAAIAVMWRRVNGEADIDSMGEWLDLNYPQCLRAQ
jgi:hypothetical protein